MTDGQPARPDILVHVPFSESGIARLRESFTVHRADSMHDADHILGSVGDRLRGVVTNGELGLTRAQIMAMPRLEIVVFKGAGHEAMDIEFARSRGIVVATGGGTNAITVADHALALMLALLRDIPRTDLSVRQGRWLDDRSPRPTLSGKRLGIVGLGRIGRLIADRAAGFDVTIAYHGRRAQADVPYAYKASVVELAAASDILVLCCPGGPATRGIVDHSVLTALGPNGYLVNVARGSVVDAGALVDALRHGTIAAAAIDVWEEQPDPVFPQRLLDAPNLLITPHIASKSPEAAAAALERIVGNLTAQFNGGDIVERLA